MDSNLIVDFILVFNPMFNSVFNALALMWLTVRSRTSTSESHMAILKHGEKSKYSLD